MTGRSSLLGSGLVEDRIVLSDVSRPLGLSLFILSRSFLLDVGLGLSMRWARVTKFFNPTSTYVGNQTVELHVLLFMFLTYV